MRKTILLLRLKISCEKILCDSEKNTKILQEAYHEATHSTGLEIHTMEK